jgi:hypothetical protein
MRLARIVLIVTGLVLGTTPILRAQHSAGRMDADCACNTCAPSGRTQGCCPPLLSSITQGIHDVLGSLLCCPGLNARHDIYRAALYRNDFGKCSVFLPFYSCRTSSCGRVNAGCQQCGPGNDEGGEEVMEMQEVPEGVPTEPTPALESQTPPVPVEAVPPKAARGRSPQGQGRAAMHRAMKPNASPKTARNSNMRDRVVSAEVAEKAPQSVQRTAAEQSPKAPSLIQRAMLFQTRDAEPVNSLRK